MKLRVVSILTRKQEAIDATGDVHAVNRIGPSTNLTMYSKKSATKYRF